MCYETALLGERILGNSLGYFVQCDSKVEVSWYPRVPSIVVEALLLFLIPVSPPILWRRGRGILVLSLRSIWRGKEDINIVPTRVGLSRVTRDNLHSRSGPVPYCLVVLCYLSS